MKRLMVHVGRLGDTERILEGEGAGEAPDQGRNVKRNRQGGGRQQSPRRGRRHLELGGRRNWGVAAGLRLRPSLACLLREGERVLASGIFFLVGIVLIIIPALQRVGKLSHRGPELAGKPS